MNTKTIRLGGAILASLVMFSCVTTRNSRFYTIDQTATQGSYKAAVQELEAKHDSLFGPHDQLLYYLDSGMLNFYAANYRQSIVMLRKADHLIGDLYSKSVTQEASSFLVNNNVIDYSGEDFENIYLNVFSALSYLKEGDRQDAFVEVRKMNNKLNLLQDRYAPLEKGAQGGGAGPAIHAGRDRFHDSALGRYLSMVMYRASGNYDGARIDLKGIRNAFRSQPDIYSFPDPVRPNADRPPTESRLSLLAFTGQAPLKRAVSLTIDGDQGMVRIRYENENERGQLIPQGYASFPFPGVDNNLHVSFQLPRLELRGSRVDRIELVVDGKPIERLSMLEDMQKVAQVTFKIREPLLFLKTVTRVILKGIAADKAKNAMNQAAAQSGSLLGAVAGFVGGMATDATVDASERADLRVSRYFPAFAYVGESQLSPGQHQVEVRYYGKGELIHVDRIGEVNLTSGSSKLVTSFFNQ